MTMRRAALPTIARALREQGATVDECIERFGVPDLRAELSELERLIEARQLVPAANAGARKEALLRSVHEPRAASWLPLAARLRGAIAAVAVVVAAGTAVAAAADPTAVLDDIGRQIGISGDGEESTPESFELRGVVASVDQAARRLVVKHAGGEAIELSVGEETRLIGVSGLDAIVRGVTVIASGTIEDGRYRASEIEVISTDEGDSDSSSGIATEPHATPGVGTPAGTPDEAPAAAPDLPGSNSDEPEIPAPESTPPADVPDDIPALPELPLDPPELPDDPLDLPLPDLPLPDLPLPDLPLPPLLP
jgi:hypothetical protein